MVTFAQIYLFYKHFNPTYLHLPHFLLKVHQLVLKASSDANGDLRIVKMAGKAPILHLQTPHQLLQVFHFVLKVSHLQVCRL